MISANIPNEVRKMIYRRDGYACALCGNPKDLQIHHAIPRGAGGGNTPRNLIALCKWCHAMAHGINLDVDVYLTRDEIVQYSGEVEQYCVEYLDDMYASSFPEDVGLFSPKDNYKYDLGESAVAISEIEVCIKRSWRWRK